MGKENNQVNAIIRCIAMWKTLQKVKLLLLLLLLIDFFVRFGYRYGLTTFFILLWLVIGPFIMEQVLVKDNTKDYQQVMPVLCAKYHYQDKQLKANIVTLCLCLLFLLALLYANLQSSITENYILYAPVAYIGIAVVAVVLLYLRTKSRIHILLENNLL